MLLLLLLLLLLLVVVVVVVVVVVMESGEGSTMRNLIVCTVHLIASVIKSRRLRFAGHVARMEEGRSAFKILIGKLTGRRPLGRLGHTWERYVSMRGIGLIRLWIGIIGEPF